MADNKKPLITRNGIQVTGGPVEFNVEDYLKLPYGDDSKRPGVPGNGYFRFSSTNKKPEWWNGFEWRRSGTQMRWITRTATTVMTNDQMSYGILVDTTSGGFIITLPPSPQAGDTVTFKDLKGTWSKNPVTLLAGGTTKIQGNTSLNPNGYTSLTLEYTEDSTYGWVIKSTDQNASIVQLRNVDTFNIISDSAFVDLAGWGLPTPGWAVVNNDQDDMSGKSYLRCYLSGSSDANGYIGSLTSQRYNVEHNKTYRLGVMVKGNAGALASDWGSLSYISYDKNGSSIGTTLLDKVYGNVGAKFISKDVKFPIGTKSFSVVVTRGCQASSASNGEVLFSVPSARLVEDDPIVYSIVFG